MQQNCYYLNTHLSHWLYQELKSYFNTILTHSNEIIALFWRKKWFIELEKKTEIFLSFSVIFIFRLKINYKFKNIVLEFFEQNLIEQPTLTLMAILMGHNTELFLGTKMKVKCSQDC